MAVPDPPFSTPRIMKVLEPSAGQYEVIVRMDPLMASKFPDKPFGTAITEIGLAAKDTAKYAGYTLVSIEPADKGAKDHYWIFQKLDGPAWTTTSNSKDNLTPQKYRSQTVVVKTEQEVDPATAPTTLAGNLVSSVVTQTPNTGKAVLTDITETITENVIPLAGEEYGDIVTKSVSEVLVVDGTPADTGFNVISSVVEPIGNGKSVKQTKTAKGGWSDPVENESSKEVPDLIPAKYRKSVTRGKKTRKVSDIPANIGLGNGETARVYKRETPDRVEETVVTEVLDNNGAPLVGKTITRDGQIGDVVEQLVVDGSVLEASATVVDGSVEALGNGMSVKRTVTVPSVFPETRKSVEKSDLLPVRFQATSPILSTTEVMIGEVTEPILGEGEISRQEDQITIHKKRVSVSHRAQGTPTALEGSTAYSNDISGLTTSDQIVPDGTPADFGFNVISSNVTPLGNGKSVKETVRATDLSQALVGSSWDHELNASVLTTRQYVQGGQTGGAYETVTPINKDRSLKVTEAPPLEALNSYHLQIPGTHPANDLPEIVSAVVAWNVLNSDSEGESKSTGYANGESWSLSLNASSKSSGSVNIDPAINIVMKHTEGRLLGAVHHFFFMPTNATSEQITARAGADGGTYPGRVGTSHTITAVGMRAALGVTANCGQSVHQGKNGNGRVTSGGFDVDQSVSTTTQFIQIPPCTGAVEVDSMKEETLSVTARAFLTGGTNFPSITTIPRVAEVTVKGSVVGKAGGDISEPPTGSYAVAVSCEPYKWGYMKCHVKVATY